MELSLKKINKKFATNTILSDIDLNISSGSFISILGPSGCGKSTLLRLIAQLDFPSSGEITYGAKKVENLSFVFQEPRLFHWRNVLSNVSLPLELKNIGKEECQKLAQEYLSLVGLGSSLYLYPKELSGGMKMRVSLARALITNPQAILLDEPFAALDEITRENLNQELMRLWLEQKWTGIFVTHNIFEAVYLSEKVYIMKANPGEILFEINVNLPYPRKPEIRSKIEFAQMVGTLQEKLQNAL